MSSPSHTPVSIRISSCPQLCCSLFPGTMHNLVATARQYLEIEISHGSTGWQALDSGGCTLHRLSRRCTLLLSTMAVFLPALLLVARQEDGEREIAPILKLRDDCPHLQGCIPACGTFPRNLRSSILTPRLHRTTQFRLASVPKNANCLLEFDNSSSPR